MKSFKQGNIELINADCMDYMKTLPDNAFDLAIVDPPYGIGIVQQMEKTVKSKSSMMNLSKGITGGHWDDAIPDKEYFLELKRVSKKQIIWGGNYFLDHLGNTRCFLVWDKMNGTNPMADAELAWTNLESSVRMFRMHHFSSGYGDKQHPTQKPIKLYQWILEKHAKNGESILDTHLGSGSSAIAAHYAGHKFVGIELDKDYYQAAIERFSRETSQVDMFGGAA